MARRTRRFWSEEEKRRIVAQTCAPGVSVSQVGRRYDVNANLIFKWRRDPRYRPAEDGAGALSFLPVEMVPEPALSPAPCAASDGRIEIALSSGHRISASGSFDVDTLCRVVRVLGCCSTCSFDANQHANILIALKFAGSSIDVEQQPR